MASAEKCDHGNFSCLIITFFRSIFNDIEKRTHAEFYRVDRAAQLHNATEVFNFYKKKRRKENLSIYALK